MHRAKQAPIKAIKVQLAKIAEARPKKTKAFHPKRVLQCL